MAHWSRRSPGNPFAPGGETNSVSRVVQRPAQPPLVRVPLFAVIGLTLVLNAGAAPYRAGAWNLDVSVAPDQPAVMLGEPAWLSFTVKNLSDENLQILVGGDYNNELGRPSSFQIKTTRSDGRWVSQPDVGLTEGGFVRAENLPAHGSYVFRLFLPHWATITETGTYTIACHRTLQLIRAGADFRQQPTTDVVTDARTTLIVQPRDAEQMGRLITALGEAVLRAEGSKPGDESVIALSWIDDARVVPWFRRAFAIRSYALKFIAVQVLARFATDEALEGLQEATRARAADFDTEAGDNAKELATKIRVAAIGALSRSKHSRAREVLVAQRRDEEAAVRLAVLRAIASSSSAEAIPLVQEMTRDPSAGVSDEAKRYLTALWRRAGAGEAKR